MVIDVALDLENGSIPELSPEEGWALLDAHARETLGISAAEFARKWDAGEFGDDPDDNPHVMLLASLLPFVRPLRTA